MTLSRLFGINKEARRLQESNTGENNGAAAAQSNGTTAESHAPAGTGKAATGEEPAAKARIYNLIIVDESGSMSSLTRETVTGVNETINSIKSAQSQFADTQEHFLTLVTFDTGGSRDDVRTLLNRVPIADVKEFTNYCPNGCTPLYDAMGKSINELYEFIKDDDNATGSVTVITDGYENSSREWTLEAVRALIERMKALGWSFSYMGADHDVTAVSASLSITHSVKFEHTAEGSASTWARERSAKERYLRRMDQMYRDRDYSSDAERRLKQRAMADDYYSNRVTPHQVRHLGEGEIFVFGSNAQGMHAGGAARSAVEHYGAVMGQGEGLQGRSYAIPTMEGLDNMREAVTRFIQFADQHPELKFLVTRIGCGIAGYRVSEVAPLFRGAVGLENIALPADFWKALGLEMK